MWPRLLLGPFEISSYGVLNAAAFLTGIIWLRARRAALGLDERAFWAAVWCLLLGGLAGAKGLFLVLGWEHFAEGRLSLWSDFRVGFVFFGGVIGALAAGAAFARRRGLTFLRGADNFAVAVPLGHALGRLGCFAAGCCHGRPSGMPWAAVFTDPVCLTPASFLGVPLHPVQLYEAAGLVVIAWACWKMLKRVREGRWAEGSVFRAYLGLYGVLRLGTDLFRGDGRPERWLGLSHQQGLALACLAAALIPGVWKGRNSAGGGSRTHKEQSSTRF